MATLFDKYEELALLVRESADVLDRLREHMLSLWAAAIVDSLEAKWRKAQEAEAAGLSFESWLLQSSHDGGRLLDRSYDNGELSDYAKEDLVNKELENRDYSVEFRAGCRGVVTVER